MYRWIKVASRVKDRPLRDLNSVSVLTVGSFTTVAQHVKGGIGVSTKNFAMEWTRSLARR